MIIVEIPGAPRTAFWPRGSEAGEPDLRVDIPGRGRLYIAVAIVYPYSSPPGPPAQAEDPDQEGAYPVGRARAAGSDCRWFGKQLPTVQLCNIEDLSDY